MDRTVLKNRIWFHQNKKSIKVEKSKQISEIETRKRWIDNADDLKVNSQKFETGKKQIWTVDPQDFFRIAPH